MSVDLFFSDCYMPKSLQRNYIQHEHLNSQTFWNTINGGYLPRPGFGKEEENN